MMTFSVAQKDERCFSESDQRNYGYGRCKLCLLKTEGDSLVKVAGTSGGGG